MTETTTACRVLLVNSLQRSKEIARSNLHSCIAYRTPMAYVVVERQQEQELVVAAHVDHLLERSDRLGS